MPPWGFSWTRLSARLGHLVAFSTAWPSCWETRDQGPDPRALTVPLEDWGGSSCLQSQLQYRHATFTSPSSGVAWKWWWLYYQQWVGIFIKSTKYKNLQKQLFLLHPSSSGYHKQEKRKQNKKTSKCISNCLLFICLYQNYIHFPQYFKHLSHFVHIWMFIYHLYTCGVIFINGVHHVLCTHSGISEKHKTGSQNRFTNDLQGKLKKNK